jgi:MYXO-CTERM domain-containing protein
MPDNGFRLPRAFVAVWFAIAVTLPAFGFGGHTIPPAPPNPLAPPDVGPPANDSGANVGAPSPDEIPVVLLKPDQNDIGPPGFDNGGPVNPTPPPDATSPNSTPEPATLLTGLLGAGVLGAVRLRKRRRQ